MNSAKKLNLMSAMRTFVSHLSFLIPPPHPFTSSLSLIPLLLLLVAAGEANATGVRMRHDIVLKSGWNAFYLPVTLEESADVFFADWPTDRVGCYDQAAYLRTKQFTTSADESTQGAIEPRMRLWVRDEPGRSTLRSVVGNAVYLVNVTNRTGFTKTVYGEPVALRMDWHCTTGDDCPLNYLGISTDGTAAQVTSSSYLLGLNTDWETRYAVGGRPTLAQPNLTLIGKDPSVANSLAVAMDSRKTGDWSGPLCVSPANGFDLGTNGTMGVLKVRNDSGTNRIVRVAFSGSARQEGVPLLPVPAILYLDPVRHVDWQRDNLADIPYERELLAGETLSLRLAVNRAVPIAGPEGSECGGIVTVTDVSPADCTHFQTAVPFAAVWTSYADDPMAGLWLANVSLDRVSGFDEKEGATEPVSAGAPMNLRLLVHVGEDGAMNLLQRARVGDRRVTAAALPSDDPIRPGTGTFAKRATFGWTVAETSRVNPFYHAKHPDHDGLRTDFKTPLPSGDDFNNYVSTVKPELFSVSNTVELVWDERPWTPDELLTGTCAWTFSGLRREGAIRAEGSFTMRRISKHNLNETKEELK